ncbi:hypothetical protein [Nitrososphaera sp.]|uniref:hypothetical protein n=1 Tax=Nitrososphaera sp. TaxID=1971748 RepID=UPI002ED935BB
MDLFARPLASSIARKTSAESEIVTSGFDTTMYVIVLTVFMKRFRFETGLKTSEIDVRKTILSMLTNEPDGINFTGIYEGTKNLKIGKPRITRILRDMVKEGEISREEIPRGGTFPEVRYMLRPLEEFEMGAIKPFAEICYILERNMEYVKKSYDDIPRGNRLSFLSAILQVLLPARWSVALWWSHCPSDSGAAAQLMKLHQRYVQLETDFLEFLVKRTVSKDHIALSLMRVNLLELGIPAGRGLKYPIILSSRSSKKGERGKGKKR